MAAGSLDKMKTGRAKIFGVTLFAADADDDDAPDEEGSEIGSDGGACCWGTCV